MGHASAGCALTFAGFAFRAAFASAASSSVPPKTAACCARLKVQRPVSESARRSASKFQISSSRSPTGDRVERSEFIEQFWAAHLTDIVDFGL